jgi:hypothetical protein
MVSDDGALSESGGVTLFRDPGAHRGGKEFFLDKET